MRPCFFSMSISLQTQPTQPTLQTKAPSEICGISNDTCAENRDLTRADVVPGAQHTKRACTPEAAPIHPAAFCIRNKNEPTNGLGGTFAPVTHTASPKIRFRSKHPGGSYPCKHGLAGNITVGLAASSSERLVGHTVNQTCQPGLSSPLRAFALRGSSHVFSLRSPSSASFVKAYRSDPDLPE